jgi:hypothetical protein
VTATAGDDGTTADRAEAGAHGADWHARHARTAAPGTDDPTVSIDRVTAESDWHVRHGHVRRLSGQ